MATTKKTTTAKKSTRKATTSKTKKTTPKRKTKEELKAMFRKVVKGRNFFTPKILGYFEVKDGVAELSSGNDPQGATVYGVTVVQKGSLQSILSNIFFSKQKATDYITQLK